MKRPRLFLIDGSSYIFRAFHALPYLSSPRGLPTNAIYGFTRMLLKVIREERPDYIMVAFDSKGPSFRHRLYEAYKAHRPEMPDSLKPQIPYIKEVVKALSVPGLEVEGYEADDVIGTVARRVKGQTPGEGLKVVILSGDKDMFQLVDEDITILDPMKDKTYRIEDVKRLLGVEPHQVVDLIGLAGDTTDNIPGVPGIGEKTATKLIQEFGTIEGVLKNLEGVKGERLKGLLKAHTEAIRLSRGLALIDTNVAVTVRLEDLILVEPDYRALRRLFKELGFGRLLKEITPHLPKGLEGRDYHLILDEEGFFKLLKEIKEGGGFAISVKVTRRLSPGLIGIALSLKPSQAFYIPTGHSYLGQPRQLDRRLVLDGLKPILEDEGIRKWGADIKHITMVLRQWGIGLRGVEVDLGVASYLINSTMHNHSLEEIAQEYLDITLSSVASGGDGFDRLDVETGARYACEECDVIFRLARVLLQRLEEKGLLRLFKDVEMPLVEVLAEMELRGVKVDRTYLEGLSKELDIQLTDLQTSVYHLAGGEFNINSPKQLAEVLFERLKLRPLKRTKTGYSTDEEVLTTLALEHELPREIINYRGLSKLKSTYVDALIALINPETGRVHTSFNQTVTATGRLSSSDPNLQNIPIRTELGKRIREAFIAEDGFLFLSADYSQIELRLVAHLSQDPLLCHAFQRGEDIHRRTASQVFGMPSGGVTEEMRRRAKAINFGIIYGMGPYGLSQELGITQTEARGYIDAYFSRYKDVKAFIDKTISDTRERGYATTLMARRRYIPELLSESESVRRFGERVAINSVIQGTAADIIKVAMVNIYKRLKGLSSRIVLQIHDELLLEVAEGEVEPVKALVEEEMEGVVRLSVPVKVNIGVGRNWREAGEG